MVGEVAARPCAAAPSREREAPRRGRQAEEQRRDQRVAAERQGDDMRRDERQDRQAGRRDPAVPAGSRSATDAPLGSCALSPCGRCGRRTAPSGGRPGGSRASRRSAAAAPRARVDEFDDLAGLDVDQMVVMRLGRGLRSARGRRRNRGGRECPPPRTGARCDRRWRSRSSDRSRGALVQLLDVGMVFASDSTRAMTRRCSVIRRPRSAHSASRSIVWCKCSAR